VSPDIDIVLSQSKFVRRGVIFPTSASPTMFCSIVRIDSATVEIFFSLFVREQKVAKTWTKKQVYEGRKVQWDKVQSGKVQSDKVQLDEVLSDKVQSDKVKPDKVQ
jgi:hypothetical protein